MGNFLYVDEKFGTYWAPVPGVRDRPFPSVAAALTAKQTGDEIVTVNRLLFARVATSDATTTGQTLVDITGLSLPLDANGVYEFEAVLSVNTSAVTTGTKYGVQFSQAGASVEGTVHGSLTASASQAERVSALNTAGLAYLTTSGQDGAVRIAGILTVGATAGNLTIQHLKVTSGTSTVRINSFLKARRIA